MSLLHDVLESSIVQRLGWSLLHSLWEGAAVAILLAVVLAILKKRSAESRYAAACVAMTVLAVTPVLTFSVLQNAPSATTAALTSDASTNDLMQTVPSQSPALIALHASAGRSNEPTQTLTSPAAPQEAHPSIPERAATPLLSLVQRILGRIRDTLPWLVLAWAAGVLGLSVRNLGAWVAVHRLKSLACRAVSDAVRTRAERLCQRMELRRPVRLLESALAQSPLVIGAIKPVMLLPASVLCEMPVSQLESILAHELAHIRRHDYLANLLQSVIETLLFYHPAVWWIGRRIRLERENCCDDMAVRFTGDRAAYARALASVAAVRMPALAPAAAGGMVLARVRRILGVPSPDAFRASGWLASAIALGMCLTVLILVRASGANQKQTDAQPPVASPSTPTAISGRVSGPDDRPVANASVWLVDVSNVFESEVTATAKSGPDGSFQFPAETVGGREYCDILAQAPGLSVGGRITRPGQVCEIQLTQPANVRVIVLGPDGKPAAGVRMRPTRLTGTRPDFWSASLPKELGDSFAVVTDAHGMCQPAGLPLETNVLLDADDARFALCTFEDAMRTGTGGDTPPATIRLQEASSISGAVGLPDGRGAGGIEVGAQGISAVTNGGGVMETDAQGVYHITRLKNGTYNVMTYLRGAQERDWTAAALEKVALRPGEDLDHQDLKLIRGGLVTGRVFLADTNKPVPHVRVAAHGPAHPRSSASVQGSLTDDDGRYTLRVPPGRQYVYFQDMPPDGYLRPPSGNPSNLEEKTVLDGQTAVLDFKLPRDPSPPLSGRVIGADGKPAAGAMVSGEPSEGDMTTTRFAKADDQGRFHFVSLPAGARVRARLGHQATTQPVFARGGESDMILKLADSRGLSATVLVTDAAGKPVAGAVVGLITWTGRTGRGSVGDPTAMDGRVTLKNLVPDQRYSISVQADGYGHATADVRIDAKSNTVGAITVVLKKADQRIAGRVVDRDGRGVAGVTVEINGVETWHRSTVTAADGSFSFAVVPGARALVWVRGDDGQQLPPHDAWAGDTNITLMRNPAPVRDPKKLKEVGAAGVQVGASAARPAAPSFDADAFNRLDNAGRLKFVLGVLTARDRSLQNFSYKMHEIDVNYPIGGGVGTPMHRTDREFRRIGNEHWMRQTDYDAEGTLRADWIYNWYGRAGHQMPAPDNFKGDYPLCSITAAESHLFGEPGFNEVVGFRVYDLEIRRAVTAIDWLGDRTRPSRANDVAMDRLNGTPTIRVQVTDGDQHQAAWLDPARGYMIARFDWSDEIGDRFTRSRDDVRDAEQIAGVWVPKKAVRRATTSASYWETEFTYDVSDFRVGAVRGADVRIEFPKGAMIRDDVLGVCYVPLPDGKYKLLPWGDPHFNHVPRAGSDVASHIDDKTRELYAAWPQGIR